MNKNKSKKPKPIFSRKEYEVVTQWWFRCKESCDAGQTKSLCCEKSKEICDKLIEKFCKYTEED